MISKYNSDNDHAVYINKLGTEVPSATTILKILNKPQLVKWANYLGFKHMNVDSVLNESASLGTLVHRLINSLLSNKLIIYINDGTISNALLYSYINRFKMWLKTHTVEPILLEQKITSDKFGGTIDFYGSIDGKLTVLDFKTSKKIRLSMFFQLALYVILLEELGYEVEQVGILLVNPINKDEKYIQRKDFEKYVIFAKGLVDLFHSYNLLNDDDKWNESII